MTIKERITEDMKSAMRAHDTARLSALRLLLAAIKQREVDDRVEATDELVTGVIGKLIKQRRDSVKQYTDAGRADLAQKEQDEIDTLSVYMPAQMSDDDIKAIVAAAIEGDVEAINQILSYFQPFINSECKREYRDEFGKIHYVTDEYMKRRLETKLITKILDFKIRL